MIGIGRSAYKLCAADTPRRAEAEAIEEAARRRERLNSGRVRPPRLRGALGLHRTAPDHMEVVYHPLVRRDVEEPLSYYRKISTRLADEFHAELRSTIDQAAENPLRFHLGSRLIDSPPNPRIRASDSRMSRLKRKKIMAPG